MTRPVRARLEAAALRHNLGVVRRCAPTAQIMAVVKANAYGHGLSWVAGILADNVQAFGVASAEEGLQLRQSAIRLPVCLLEGVFSRDELALADRHRFEPVLHRENQVRWLEEASLSRPLDVWLKADTGMHRLGFPPEKVPEILARLQRCRAVASVRLMSHFACADEPKKMDTRHQIDRFAEIHGNAGIAGSLANSAGVLAWPESHLDWVRPGIMLYGSQPVGNIPDPGLWPVMTLTTELIAVHRRNKGDAVGYGGDYLCPENMPVGVAAVGYGDGYPRHARPGTPVLVNGKRAPLIGRVSMDMITLDLRSQPEARAGDPVVLWGQGLPIDEIAACAGTISYELMCHVTERVPRVEASGTD
jgi:alanine racemase